MSPGGAANSQGDPGDALAAVRDWVCRHPTRARLLDLIEENAHGSVDPDDLRRRLSPGEPGAAAVRYHLAVLRRANLLPTFDA